jgi:aspartyl/glutamyl-tRNA(Asn/Gln) amidotransferase C subunit
MLSDSDFQKLCKLAKISIDEENFSSFFEKLLCIFDWIQQLQSIDTSEVIVEIVDMGHSREDVLCSEIEDTRCSAVLSNTEFSKYGLFSVPKVFDYE